MDALFCPQCRSILDIPADEDFIICSVCGEKQAASGTIASRPLVSLSYIFPSLFPSIIVFEENAFVTKSRANAFTHSLKKRMAAAASVAKAGSGATVRLKAKILCLCTNPIIFFFFFFKLF